jgi:hypothetical protein
MVALECGAAWADQDWICHHDMDVINSSLIASYIADNSLIEWQLEEECVSHVSKASASGS